MTKRVLKALSHPAVHILAHPTGRQIQKRAPIDIDLEDWQAEILLRDGRRRRERPEHQHEQDRAAPWKVTDAPADYIDSMVKAIVEAHGGSVSVESAPGFGSTFRMRIPRFASG